MVRKGQMFLIGAFVLCILIASTIAGKSSLSNTTPFDDTKNTFSNMILENQKVINIILKENMTSDNLENRLIEHSIFLDRIGKEHSLDLTGYFIVAIPVGDNLNISIMNFGKKSMKDIKVRINDTETIIGDIESMRVNTTTIANVPEFMKFNYSYLESNGINDELYGDQTNTNKRVFSYSKLRFENTKNVRQSITFN